MPKKQASPVFPARAAGNPFANQLREVFGKVRQRMQPTGLQGGQAQAPGARFQAMADNAPAGAVGAPGGLQQPGRQATPQDALSALLTGGAMVPGPAGDVLGPLADAYMYATDPESRTLGNAAMSALGVLPFLPSLATVYHGSQHVFRPAENNPLGEFDLSKIGTGEGAIGSAGEKPRVLTLFSGGGSYEEALKGKVRPVGAVEFDPAIGGHYRNVHGEHVQVKDVREVDFTPFRGQVDIMHASPVCKRASAAKCAAGEQELDMETAQATARALGEVEPAVFTLENVPQYQKFGAFKVITDKLDELGYNWDVVRHDAAQLGSPSRRDRIMLRASKGQLPPAQGAAAPAAQADWFSAVEDLLPTMPRSNLANWQRQRLMAQGINPDALERPLLVGGGSGMKGTIPAAQQGGPAWTIKATAKELGGDRIVMPGGETYTLTPRAYARLLGLPDEYPLPDDARLAKTIVGNSMAPAMTREVMEPFLKMLAEKGGQ